MKLSFLERGLAALSPTAAARRLGARMALAELQGIASTVEERKYDAARRDRRTGGWHTTGGSPAAEMANALGLIIRRCRDLIRNNEWARNARRKWVAQAVDSGIVPRPNLATGKAKDVANAAWTSFVENCDPEGLNDFYGKQALAMGEVFEGGACFVRWYLRPPSWNLKVPLQCVVLPHEFLDRSRNFVSGANIVLQGVEFDPDGRRVAYYLYRQHPGEYLPIARDSLVSDRVPASQVDHIFMPELAGQITGMPWLAVTALRLRDIADRDEAALLREKIAACLSVLVRRQGGVANSLGGQAGKDPKTGQQVEKLGPGMVGYIESDGDITVVNPPSAGDVEFVNRNLLAVAAGVGLQAMSLSGDVSKANFSSMRAGNVDFEPNLRQVQNNMLIPMMCRPAWKRVMAAAAGRGLQVSADTTAKWAVPVRPYVNPVDDMKANAGMIAMGLQSWRDTVVANGYDPDEILEEFTEDLPKIKKAGLSPTTPAGIAGDRLQQQPPSGGQADPSAPANQE